MTFNRLANIQYSRLKNKVLIDPLQEPTIPIIATAFQPITEEDYLVLDQFLDTDLLNGEIAINTESDRVWVRSNDSIIELNTTTASGFRPLSTNHIWIGESGLAKEYNLGNGFLVGTNSVSVGGYTSGNGITLGASGSIDLGGNLTSNVFFDGLNGTSSMFIGSYGPNKQLSSFSVGTNNGVGLYHYNNNVITSGLSLGNNNATLSSNIKEGSTFIMGAGSYVSGYDNRRFGLYLYGSGIPTGSGEYFVINGYTFSEGVDFIGQNDPALDAQSIAGLTYSSDPDFISIDYTIGFNFLFFNFSTPAVVSSSFSNATFDEYQYNTQLSLNTYGAMLTSGNNALVINNSIGEHKFSDAGPNPKGLQYASNYDATLVDDSLVPKRYVDDSISTISLTAGNGITIGASGSIDLGGTLNQPTTLLGNNQTFDLGTTASQLSFLRINAIQSYEQYLYAGEGLSITQNPGTFKTDIDYSSSSGYRSFIEQSPAVISTVVSSNSGYDQTQITQSSQQINILTRTAGGPDSGFTLDQIGDSFRFVDNRLTPRGLEYQDDYSANFSVRSLIDKGYLDSVISGLTDLSIYTTNGTIGSGRVASLTDSLQIGTGFNLTDSVLTMTGSSIMSSGGSTDTLNINHTSGSGHGVYINKAGAGDGLHVVKTSGGGNAARISGGSLNMDSQKIINVLDPTNAQDAATKNYVDGRPDTNFANTDLTLTGNRDHIMGSTTTLSFSRTSGNKLLEFKNGSTGIKGNNLLVTPGDVVDQALNLKYQTSTNTGLIIPIGTSGSGKGNLNIQATRTTIENIWTNNDVKISGDSVSIGAVRTIEIPFYDGTWKGINLRTIQENGGGARFEIQTSPGGLGGTYQNAMVVNKSGSVVFRTITSQPTLTENNTNQLWLNGSVPTIRLRDNLGVESNVPLQSTTNAITKTSGVFNRTLTLEAPTATENITIFRTDVAITIQEVIAVSTGTSPSTTYQIKHSTDRSAAGSNLTTSGTTTSTTTGNVATLSVASVPADSWVWLITTAATGTSVKLSIDIRYTID